MSICLILALAHQIQNGLGHGISVSAIFESESSSSIFKYKKWIKENKGRKHTKKKILCIVHKECFPSFETINYYYDREGNREQEQCTQRNFNQNNNSSNYITWSLNVSFFEVLNEYIVLDTMDNNFKKNNPATDKSDMNTFRFIRFFCIFERSLHFVGVLLHERCEMRNYVIGMMGMHANTGPKGFYAY